MRAFDSHYQSTNVIRDRGAVAPWWIAVPTDQYREDFHCAAATTRAEAQANLQSVNTAVYGMTSYLLAEALAASVTSSQGVGASTESEGLLLLTGVITDDET